MPGGNSEDMRLGILEVLAGRTGPIASGHIAERLCIAPRTKAYEDVGRMCSALAKEGLLEKVGQKWRLK